jgi:tetratricopeptide (TPR) repeat protein
MGHLGHSFPTTRRGVRLAIAWEVLRQVAQRLLQTSSAKPPRGEVDPTVQDTMRLITALGWIESGIDQERLLLCALWAANFAERKGDLLGVATGFYGIGMTCDILGLRRFAGYYHRRALAAAEQVQHPNALAQAYFGLALHGLCGGDWATAVGHFERAAGIYRAMGDLHGWAANVVYPVRMWGLCGDPASALDRLLETISVCRDGGDAQALAFALQGLAIVLVHTGPLTEAVEAAQEAIELNRTVPNYASMGATSGELGLAYLRMGKLEQALGMLESTIGLVDTRRVVGTSPTYPRNALATAYLIASEQASGSEREAWLKKARRACQAALRQGKVDCTGWLYALRMQARYEWLRGHRQGALRIWQRGLAEAQRLQAPYEIGMFHLEMGERLGECAHLEQAEAILARVGATLDWERTCELLGRVAVGPVSGARQV